MAADIVEKPAAGQLVRVRTRHWLVEDVAPSANGSWLRLSCLDDDAQGDSLEVIWESELDGQILAAEAWAKIGHKGFDDARHFAAYFNTLRWHCVTATDPKLFQAPFRALPTLWTGRRSGRRTRRLAGCLSGSIPALRRPALTIGSSSTLENHGRLDLFVRHVLHLCAFIFARN